MTIDIADVKLNDWLTAYKDYKKKIKPPASSDKWNENVRQRCILYIYIYISIYIYIYKLKAIYLNNIFYSFYAETGQGLFESPSFLRTHLLFWSLPRPKSNSMKLHKGTINR